MKNREDFLKRLREDPAYRAALGQAKTAAERKHIQKVVEDFIAPFADILGPAIAQAESDPEFATKLGLALVEKQGVLSQQDQKTPTSGSIA